MNINELEPVEIVSIEEDGEEECYDISNYENDCIDNEGNFFCNDILVHNCIPEYIKNRDNPNWHVGMDERIATILKSTYGVIVYQEQLTAMWVKLAKFTVPEAEQARKIIAKKWTEKLPQIEVKWLKGASKTIGEQAAKEWWEKMVTFGRYAFNLAHAIAYSLVTFECLYLKSHYPTEWWASVMTACHQEKLSKYMGAAKIDGVQFGSIDINSMRSEFSVENGKVLPGLQAIKGFGEKAIAEFSTVKGPFKNIDQLVEKVGKQKVMFERLIKLGAFDSIHPNRKGLWNWYQYKYCSGTELKVLRQEIDSKFAWEPHLLESERERQRVEFKKLYPGKKIPVKINKWLPQVGYRHNLPVCYQVINLYEDYTKAEKTAMEREFFGFYWTTPLNAYHTHNLTIDKAKLVGQMEVVIESVTEKTAKTSGNRFYVFKVTDGIQHADITVWGDIYRGMDKEMVKPGVGVKIKVEYNSERNSFKIANKSMPTPLVRCDQPDEDSVTQEESVHSSIPAGEFPAW